MNAARLCAAFVKIMRPPDRRPNLRLVRTPKEPEQK
jgi:hypothetical protein